MSALPKAALEMARGLLDHAIEVETESLVLDRNIDWNAASLYGDVYSKELTTLVQVQFAISRAIRELEKS